MLAVNPEFNRGLVVRTWRGDYEETTAADILAKYKDLTTNIVITQACYDYQSREFGLISSRMGEVFLPADKEREGGTQILNTLFQSRALLVAHGVYDNQKLVTELMSVPLGEKSRKYQDDLTDALRYVVKLVPWDFNSINPQQPSADKAEVKEKEIYDERRRHFFEEKQSDQWRDFRDEIEAWNELYGN